MYYSRAITGDRVKGSQQDLQVKSQFVEEKSILKARVLVSILHIWIEMEFIEEDTFHAGGVYNDI